MWTILWPFLVAAHLQGEGFGLTTSKAARGRCLDWCGLTYGGLVQWQCVTPLPYEAFSETPQGLIVTDASPWGLGGLLIHQGVITTWDSSEFTLLDAERLHVPHGESASQQAAEVLASALPPCEGPHQRSDIVQGGKRTSFRVSGWLLPPRCHPPMPPSICAPGLRPNWCYSMLIAALRFVRAGAHYGLEFMCRNYVLHALGCNHVCAAQAVSSAAGARITIFLWSGFGQGPRSLEHAVPSRAAHGAFVGTAPDPAAEAADLI
eukprot:5379721-Amphidinium_carterae.1